MLLRERSSDPTCTFGSFINLGLTAQTVDWCERGGGGGKQVISGLSILFFNGYGRVPKITESFGCWLLQRDAQLKNEGM